MLTRRGSVTAAAAMAALLAQSGAARAQPAGGTFPTKPVRFIVPYPPGGITDLLARKLGEKLGEAWGQPVVADNRPGAGGNIAAQAAARAAPDGHTIFMGFLGTHAANASLYPELGYDPVRDFTPIGLVAASPMVLTVHPSVPARTVAELVAYARANPGRLTFGSSGNGGAVHLATELFLRSAGNLRVNHVPYRGSAAAMPDVLNGTVSMILDVAGGALPYIGRGELRGLAISSKERSQFAPDLPTFIESGVPGYEAYTWHMLLVPSGTPGPVVAALNAAVNRVVQQDAIKRRLAEQTMQFAADTTQQGAVRWLRAEMDKWSAIIREAGITVN